MPGLRGPFAFDTAIRRHSPSAAAGLISVLYLCRAANRGTHRHVTGSVSRSASARRKVYSQPAVAQANWRVAASAVAYTALLGTLASLSQHVSHSQRVDAQQHAVEHREVQRLVGEVGRVVHARREVAAGEGRARERKRISYPASASWSLLSHMASQSSWEASAQAMPASTS
jgi:hypothetical protein